MKQRTKLDQISLREIKNTLKFKLTDDVQLPLETKKSHQILCKVVKQRNRVTGEERVMVEKIKRIDYEFECETLADFAY